MSRCFPYLRPNREAESVISLDEPLIETIKLPNEKEREKEKKERKKEKKREKKEKKKRSREDHLSLEPTEHSHKKRKNDEGKQYIQKEGCPAKAGEDASELLEKSSVTEEIGLPSSTQSPYDSDRSQNTNQRVNPTAVVNPIHNNNNGLIFRVRFSFGKKHKVQEPLKLEDTEPNVSCEEPCFSGRHETPQGSEPAVERLHYPSSSQRNGSTDRSETASKQSRAETADKPSSSHQRCSPTGRVGAIYKQDITESAEKPSSSQQKCIETMGQQKAPQAANAPSSSNRKLSRSERKDQRYRDIVANWNPPPFHCELSDDAEEGWLFKSRVQKCDSVVKTCNSGTEALGHGNTNTMVSIQPRACYIPDVDMYALPYVVPY
ncbi:hypothetical protein J5N97_022803 [Dioscorea zingiberensis]|uniref:Uncharacterized protein n=1 Tax=Dioscorea zingiberensis TaxID=325984 RepID=A0A9D5CB88_9LILI|nr:hypothetical protein J5N97_022803 [Dioscorea zingiberensis]